jgi:Protein of unknown function (DUF2490)
MKPSSPQRQAANRKTLIPALLLLLSAVPRPARAQSSGQFPRDDAQGWMDIEETHDLRGKVQLTLNGGLRWSQDAGHLVYRRVGGGLALKVNKYLTLSPYYNFYSTDSSRVREARENRIALAATAGVPVGRWRVRDRNLIERRFLVGGRTWRYRNRLEVERSTHLAHSHLRLFVWDEVFYDSAVSAWARNRAAIGAGKEISQRLSLDLYYLRQNDRFTRPGDLNVIGITIRAHL